MDGDRTAPDYGPDIRQTKVKGAVAGWRRDADGQPIERNGKRQREVRVLREIEVEREDRVDIADPAKNKRTIRGARRRDGLMLMWRRGQLSDALMAAAEKFRDDLAIASGAGVSLPGETVQTRTRGRNFEPSVAQVDAITRCKAAWGAVGPLHQPVLSWVVIGWGTLGGYAECKHMRPARATDLMLTALDRLATFYTDCT